MEQRLSVLIEDYLAAVAKATELLADSGIPLPNSNIEWACNGIRQVGELKGGIPYFKHGYGCRVTLPTGEVDFDFGDGGQTNGVDLWRLAAFADDRLGKYGFDDEAELKESFERALREQEIKYSGYILHYQTENEA